jgi:hypothetical protein
VTHPFIKAGIFTSLVIVLSTVGASSLSLHAKAAQGQQAPPAQTGGAVPAAAPAPATPGQPGAPGAAGSGRGRGGFREPDPIDFDDRTGYTEMFDGTTLAGWDGNPDVWKVADGAIVGQRPIPPDGAPATGFRQTFLVWQGGEPADFELKLEIKLEGEGADSGIQYRSYIAPMNPGRAGAPPPDPREAKWNVAGLQFDFNFADTYPGQVAEGGGRGIIAFRGQVVHTEEGKNPRIVAMLGDRQELGGYFKTADWNQVDLIAHGDTMIQMINGHVMSILIDDDPTKARAKGIIGLQCAGPAGSKISFRNLRIRMIS